MQKSDLATTLYELETLIRPGKPEDILVEFGKELLRRFDLDCFVAEVPMLKLRVEIPESCDDSNFQYEGSVARFYIRGELEGLEKPIRDLLERLDYVLQFSIYYELWTRIFERSPDTIVLVDEHGNMIECNKKALEIFGNIENIPRISGEVWKYNGRFYSVAEYPLGAVKAVVLRDITEIKELERAARESEERFRALAEAVPVLVGVYQKGKWVYVNKALEELTGYSREELRGGDVWIIVPEEEREKIRENMRRRLNGEHIEPYKIRLRRKDGGEVIVQVYGTVIKWGGEVAGIIVAVDVTREEEKRKKLEELTTLLEFINKILRHDVLNALTSVAAYLEVYEDVKDEVILHKAREAIERAVKIIKNMREFERIVKEGSLKIVSVREMAEEAAKGFAVPVNIKGDCNVLADDGLVTVFENLYQNAVQHGGTDRIDVEIRESDKFCEICVADYGKGIPEEIKDRVFEEGFKYGEKASTGFGLYAVKKLIERYGGEIWVEDNKPQGAVFVIRLMRV